MVVLEKLLDEVIEVILAEAGEVIEALGLGESRDARSRSLVLFLRGTGSAGRAASCLLCRQGRRAPDLVCMAYSECAASGE